MIKKGKKEEEGAAPRGERQEEVVGQAHRQHSRMRSSSWWPGLGNPGEEYENTPHNLGFLVIDRLAESHGIRVSRKENMALVGLGVIGGKQVVLAKPQTFMNLSGPAVKGLLERYGLTAGSFDCGVRRAGSAVEHRCGSSRKARRPGIKAWRA